MNGRSRALAAVPRTTSSAARPDAPAPAGRDRTVPVGEAAHHAAPARLRTLLGSCVAVTLWHPWLAVGGMCHVVNARRSDSAALRVWGGDKPPAWFADEAVPRLLRWAGTLDRSAGAWEVKVFGGGRQFAAGRGPDVPAHNLEEVRRQLERAGVEPVAWHVGGTGSRMVVLDVASGGVWINHRPRREVADAGLPLQVRRSPSGLADDVQAVAVLKRLAAAPTTVRACA